MGDISANFSRHEFACSCGCGFNKVDPELIHRLEMVRCHFGGKKVTINSGCRCPAHNKREKGKPGSKHLLGIAADIKIAGVDPDLVARFFETKWPHTGGVGRYKTFTHVDVRTEKARF